MNSKQALLILLGVGLTLLLFTLVGCSPVATAVAAEALVITNGTVIDGTGAGPIPDGIVVIQGDRIVAVGRAVEFFIPAETEVIDAGGGTIMPGIINAHVHNSYHPDIRGRALVHGVTALCDLGSPARYMSDFERDYTGQNQPVARGFRAGSIFTAPGGPPSALHYEVATPEEARAAVVDLLNRGADMIKIALEPGPPEDPWPVLSLEQAQAIVTTAHTHGAPVRVHAQQAAMLDIAQEAGVDVIEHVPVPFCSEAEIKRILEKDALRLANLPEFEAQLIRLAKQGVILVPTLEINMSVIHHFPLLEPEEQQAVANFLLEIVGHFQDVGGMIALGNDYGNPGLLSGMPLREMEFLLAAGLTPLEVIEAGTRSAAQACGHGHELGALEPGKLADVIIVDGNPLTDLAAMNRMVMVVKGGEIAYTKNRSPKMHFGTPVLSYFQRSQIEPNEQTKVRSTNLIFTGAISQVSLVGQHLPDG